MLPALQSRTIEIDQLRSEILRIQGFKGFSDARVDAHLAPLNDAFPNATFPVGALHEFISASKEGMSATRGFVTALLSVLTINNSCIAWISAQHKIFPPALRSFGVDPDRFLFIDIAKENNMLWAIEEALKCSALTAVVGEMRGISFTESRRLQLAVEQSKVTGFVLHAPGREASTTACVSRWKITALPSISVDGLPGIGHPHWRVELLRVRNGRPSCWNLHWKNNQFVATGVEDATSHTAEDQEQPLQKVG